MLTAAPVRIGTLRLDSYYTIGQWHLYCQDYTLHGVAPVPHLILADGCSSAPGSDLGARLLALSARRSLLDFVGATRLADQKARHWPLGQRIVRRAARQARILGAELDVLDATLLVAWCDGDQVWVHVYGDGCLVLRDVQERLTAIRIEYAENAPYYLTYLLDQERQAIYREAIGKPRSAQRIHQHSEAALSQFQTYPFDHPAVFNFDLTEFPLIALATDGLDSFMTAETGERLPLLDVARPILDFSEHEGAFVQSHLYETLISFARRRTFNIDDIGLGVFVRLTAVEAARSQAERVALAAGQTTTEALAS